VWWLVVSLLAVAGMAFVMRLLREPPARGRDDDDDPDGT
jgi:hypothetical protein